MKSLGKSLDVLSVIIGGVMLMTISVLAGAIAGTLHTAFAETETQEEPGIKFDTMDYTSTRYLQNDSITATVNGVDITFTYDQGKCVSICVEGGENTGVFLDTEADQEGEPYYMRSRFRFVIGGVEVKNCETE